MITVQALSHPITLTEECPFKGVMEEVVVETTEGTRVLRSDLNPDSWAEEILVILPDGSTMEVP